MTKPAQPDEQTGPTTAVSNRSAFAAEYPFSSHFFELNGLRYHYLDEGEGEPLLFVHGNPTWSFAWRKLISPLSDRYRVLAVDHIGCGLSEKPQRYPYTLRQHIDNLCRFIEWQQLDHITLVGHDWGGCIGMGAAVRFPGRFSRLVLMNTAAFRSRRIPWRIAVCRLPLLGAWGVRGLNLFCRAALRMAVVRRKNITPAARAGYLAPYNNWSNRIAIHRFVQEIPLKPSHPSYQTLVEIEEGLPQLAGKPLLLLWGERDWCFTPAFLEEFQRRFPQAETVRFPEAGHYLFEDDPAGVLSALQNFLAAQPSVPPFVSSDSSEQSG